MRNEGASPSALFPGDHRPDWIRDLRAPGEPVMTSQIDQLSLEHALARAVQEGIFSPEQQGDETIYRLTEKGRREAQELRHGRQESDDEGPSHQWQEQRSPRKAQQEHAGE